MAKKKLTPEQKAEEKAERARSEAAAKEIMERVQRQREHLAAARKTSEQAARRKRP
jgi:hypothetical protein